MQSKRSKKSKSLITAILFGLSSVPAASAAIIFVDAGSGSATQNGASWATPFHTLTPALSAAGAGDQIWVAKGTYKPGSAQTASFSLKTNVDLFGGFKNGDNSLGDADPDANPTILSGEIGQPFLNFDNSQHVVRGSGVTGILVDGFTITEGFADGTSFDAMGGGALLNSSTVEFQRCRFIANHAGGSGGGAACLNGTVTFVLCEVRDNTAGSLGGGLSFNNGTGQVVSCRVLGNSSIEDGGGIFEFVNTQLTLTNVAFSGNEADVTGGGLTADAAVTIRACSFGGNTSADGAAGLHLSSGSSGTIANCALGQNGTLDFQNEGAATVTYTCVSNGALPPGAGNILANPKFRDVDGNDGVAGTVDDNLRLRGDSPCIDHGNTAALPLDVFDLDDDFNFLESLSLDLDGNPRRIEDPVVPNLGAGAAPQPDMGAFERERPKTWFVSAGASGANNGTSWTNAFAKLEDALAAQSDPESGGPAEIWVSKGAYKPTSGTDRTKTFNIGPEAKVFGGFGGGELDRASRDPWNNVTALSGELGAATNADNSLHVVTFNGSSIDVDTVLDGFVITRGAATLVSGSSHTGGGAIIQNNAAPTIQNCRFVGNHALSQGGAIFSLCDAPGPMLLNCVIASNTAGGTGGGCSMWNCTITNCTIASNSGNTGPNGIFFNGSNAVATVANTILFGNSNSTGANELSQINEADLMIFTHCLVQCYGGAVPGTAISADRPLFINPNGVDGIAGTFDDNYHTREGSPAIDAGTANFLVGDLFDIDEDDVTAENTPFDFDLDLRAIDDPGMDDVGQGSPTPDIGADEFADGTFELPNPADLNGDGNVNGADIAFVLGNWNTSGPIGDVNNDCIVNGADIAVVLGNWTG